MSAKDPDEKKEVARDIIVSLSPNIKSSVDEDDAVDSELIKDTPNPKEVVEIDGVPISEEEMEFRAKDIKKKDGGELFVNVEGAEKLAKEKERKRQQLERQKAKDEEQQKRIAEEKKRQEEREKQAKIAAEQRKTAEHEKALARAQAQKVHQEHKKQRIAKAKKLTNLLFGGKKKFIELGVLAVIALAVGGIALNDNVIQPARIAKIQETTEKNIYIGSEEADDEEAVIQKVNDMSMEGVAVDDQLSYVQEEINKSTTESRKGTLSILYWRIYGYEKNEEEAIKKLEDIQKEVQLSYLKADALDTIALLYRHMGNEDKCQEYSNRAKEYK